MTCGLRIEITSTALMFTCLQHSVCNYMIPGLEQSLLGNVLLHTHTHTCIYIYIYIYIKKVKDLSVDGTLLSKRIFEKGHGLARYGS